MTTTTMRPEVSKILCLLAAGHTIDATATQMSWPPGTVRALANGQKGWLINTKGCVYNPNPRQNVQLPDGVNPADIEWAQQLLAANTRQVVAPKPAAPKPPSTLNPAQSARPAAPTTKPIVGAAAIEGLLTTELPIDAIHGHTGNIRDELGDLDELAASIKAHGILQPLTVQPHPVRAGSYQLLAGHRRHAAALLAGLAEVPVVIRRSVNEGVAIEVMLVENVQRRDLNSIEKAEALGKLRDQHGYSNALISSRTGMSSSTVSTLLALLELDPSSRQRVREGEITATEAVAAVREMRKKRRGARGDTTVAQWSWEPDYLTKTHPQARKAERLCNAREHTARRRIGKVACGQCWETVVREDERVVIAAQSGPS